MKKIFTLVMLSILTVCNVNAKETTLWEGDFNVSWDLPDGDPNREWGGGEGQDVTSHFVTGAKICVYLTAVAGAEYHKCQFDNWEWVALPGVDPVVFSEDTKVTIDVTEAIAAAVAEKGFRLHGHGFHVVKVTKEEADGENPVVSEEETLWTGDFNVSWDLPDGDPNREWGGAEGQDVTAHFVTGAKIFVYLAPVAEAEYHKCQFDNWEWVALPGVDPVVFSEDTKVTIDVTEEIAAAVAEKGFRLHGHGFHVVMVSKEVKESPDAIQNVENKIIRSKGLYYNLKGQTVVRPTKGIYIVNGKKCLVK